ncbi:hypothetical protein AUC43_03830 [Hymenobacter sedentarius]|uniref:Uncharacterized protein n=1 Tax=Hymenobacter sedentarius TaxID=1411621 RepID=A0A0U4CM21_9BACT|nr:hypothetical protein [Hymenobacter sedentarius]ALW84302.1 hypothetical protein AUC43_03830 [Hymenobacter sedentarius]
MTKPLPALLAAAALLTGCDNLNKPETKDQPLGSHRRYGRGYRDGIMAAGAANAVDNTSDMSRAKPTDFRFKEITQPGATVRGYGGYNVYSEAKRRCSTPITPALSLLALHHLAD